MSGFRTWPFDGCDSDPDYCSSLILMDEHSPEKNLWHVPDAAVAAGCTPRYVWFLLARGDLVRYKAAGRTYVDVDRLCDLLVPRPV